MHFLFLKIYFNKTKHSNNKWQMAFQTENMEIQVKDW